MTQEEKAKRYDEILARAKGANLPYYKEDIMSKVKEFVDYLLPELKESEDESIRKELIEYIKSKYENPNAVKYDYEKWISWLEKQGKQNSDEWSEEDVAMLDSAIVFVEHSAFTTIGKGKNSVVAWLKSLKDKYTWKPSEEQMKALSNISITGCISYAGQGQELINLYQDLKKLKG